MKASVLIAAFRAGPYLGPALASLRAQSHTDWELIVVEDGSHDETEALVAEFAATVSQPVRYDNLGQNRGVASARNRLLELATGDALAFLDADDYWEADHLERTTALIAKGAGLVTAGVRGFDLATGRELFRYHPAPELEEDPIGVLFARSEIITCSSVVMSRAAITDVNGFDPQLRIGEDRDYWLRCALNGAQFATAAGCTCNYAKHTSSAMTQTLTVAEQAVRFYRKHRNIRRVPALTRRRRLAQSYVIHARLTRRLNPFAAWRELLQAMPLTPFDFSLWSQICYTSVMLARPGRAH